MFLDHVCVGVTTNFKVGHSFLELLDLELSYSNCVHFERRDF